MFPLIEVSFLQKLIQMHTSLFNKKCFCIKMKNNAGTSITLMKSNILNIAPIFKSHFHRISLYCSLCCRLTYKWPVSALEHQMSPLLPKHITLLLLYFWSFVHHNLALDMTLKLLWIVCFIRIHSDWFISL